MIKHDGITNKFILCTFNYYFISLGILTENGLSFFTSYHRRGPVHIGQVDSLACLAAVRYKWVKFRGTSPEVGGVSK